LKIIIKVLNIDNIKVFKISICRTFYVQLFGANVGRLVVKLRYLIIIIYIVASIFAVSQWSKVKILKGFSSFLPEEIGSIKGQKLLDSAFGSSASAMLFFTDVDDKETYWQIISYIRSLPEVKSALGPDQVGIFTIPQGFLPEIVRQLFYQGKGILVTIEFNGSESDPKVLKCIGNIYNYLKRYPDVIFTGSSVMTWESEYSFRSSPFPWYFVLSIIIMLFILILNTKTLIPPILFFISLASAYIINMGTNVFLGSISYLTNALAGALQFGVSMDYALFLFHRFEEEKTKSTNSKEAMANAINKTFTAILGSSLTTLIGFLAITIMTLKIGLDLGLVIAKGVFFTLIASVTLLPSLILILEKPINKTNFYDFSFLNFKPIKSINNKFKFLFFPESKNSKDKSDSENSFLGLVFSSKKRLIIIGLIFLILLPIIIYNGLNIPVSYRLDDTMPSNLESYQSLQKIMDLAKTGDLINVVIPVPSFERFSRFNLQRAVDELKKIDGISLVASLNDYGHPSVPIQFFQQANIETFYKNGYMKIYLKTLYPPGTKESVLILDQATAILRKYFTEFYFVGQSSMLYDFIKIAQVDFARINIASIVFIFIILLFIFFSPVFATVLLLIVEFSVMLNLVFYNLFSGEISFIANMIIGSIQLGSTIDYALLFVTRFTEEYEKDKNKISAISRTVSATAKPILNAALCLFFATVGFNLFDPTKVVSCIAGLIGRGALISFIVVLIFMPSIVYFLTNILHMADNRKRRVIGMFSK